MLVMSAQSHSNVIGICHKSCGTNGCWKLSESKGAPVDPGYCCCCRSSLPWKLGVMLELFNMLVNSAPDGVEKSREMEARSPLTGSGAGEKPLRDGLNG